MDMMQPVSWRINPGDGYVSVRLDGALDQNRIEVWLTEWEWEDIKKKVDETMLQALVRRAHNEIDEGYT